MRTDGMLGNQMDRIELRFTIGETTVVIVYFSVVLTPCISQESFPQVESV